MIFHEIHNAYWRILARLLTAAAEKSVTQSELYALIREDGFAETSTVIPEKLRGEWPLLSEGKSVLSHTPPLPVTATERAFLKAALSDPRFTLFLDAETESALAASLSEAEPLWTARDLVYYDCHADGDPFGAAGYRENFAAMLTALREKKQATVTYRPRAKKEAVTHTGTVLSVEYSAKDDAFRFRFAHEDFLSTVNAAGLVSVVVTDLPAEAVSDTEKEETIVLAIENERNSLERALLHFSDLKKETTAAEGNRWQMTLYYDREDETEILIRILSFGPFLKILAPETMRSKLKARLQKQMALMEMKRDGE